MKTEEKKVVSQFEYAIGSIAEEGYADKHRPETDDERSERREKKIKEFFTNIKTA